MLISENALSELVLEAQDVAGAPHCGAGATGSVVVLGIRGRGHPYTVVDRAHRPCCNKSNGLCYRWQIPAKGAQCAAIAKP